MLLSILMLLTACKNNKLVDCSKRMSIHKEVFVDQAYKYIFNGFDEVPIYVKELSEDIQKSLSSKNIKQFGELVKKAESCFSHREITLARLFNYTASNYSINRNSLKSCFRSIAISIKNIDMAIAIDSYEAIEEIKGDEDFGAEEYYAMLKEAIDRGSDSIIARIIIDQIDHDKKDQFGIVLKMIYDTNDEDFEKRIIYSDNVLQEKLQNMSEEYMKVYYEFCPRSERRLTHTDTALISLQINRVDMLELLASLDDCRIDYKEIVDNNSGFLMRCEDITLKAFCKNMCESSAFSLLKTFILYNRYDRSKLLLESILITESLMVKILDYLVKSDQSDNKIYFNLFYRKMSEYLDSCQNDLSTKRDRLIQVMNRYRDERNSPIMFSAIINNPSTLELLSNLGLDIQVVNTFVEDLEIDDEDAIEMIQKMASSIITLDKIYYDSIFAKLSKVYNSEERKRDFLTKASKYINYQGITFLSMAIAGNPNLVSSLLEFGLNPQPDIPGEKVCSVAVAHNLKEYNTLKLLLEHGATLEVLNINEEEKRILMANMNKPVDVVAESDGSSSPMLPLFRGGGAFKKLSDK